MKTMKMNGVACVVCVVFLGLATSAAAQDRDAAFRAGLDARQEKKWPEVSNQMRLAIQADPKEDVRRVGGRLFGIGGETYLPHFFLGEALYNQNECAAAIEAWSRSEQQGVIIKERKDLLDALRKGYAACDARGVLPPAKYEPLVARTRQNYTETFAFAQRVSNLGQAKIELWRADMKELY